jgi:tRNA(Ile2) C34 agmatinyltransferase TiaS
MSKILGFSKNGEMIKIEDINDKKGYVWYFLASNVKAFATKIPIGSDVELKTEEKNGEDTVIYINKNENEGVSVFENKSGYKCAVCGVSLKDNKYKTCYNCSMEARKKEDASPEGQSKQSSIEKQAIMKCSANAVAIALQGQVDLDTLGDAICKLYDKLYMKLTK